MGKLGCKEKCYFILILRKILLYCAGVRSDEETVLCCSFRLITSCGKGEQSKMCMEKHCNSVLIKTSNWIARVIKAWLSWAAKVNDSLWQESDTFGIGFFLLWWKSSCQRNCNFFTLFPTLQPLEDSLIAFRTRSKRPLKDVPLGQLEAELRAPDITPDMYDPNTADDEEWKRWLGGLMNDDVENEGVLVLVGTDGAWGFFFFFLFLTAFSPCCSWSWLQPLPCFVTHMLYTLIWSWDRVITFQNILPIRWIRWWWWPWVQFPGRSGWARHRGLQKWSCCENYQ